MKKNETAGSGVLIADPDAVITSGVVVPFSQARRLWPGEDYDEQRRQRQRECTAWLRNLLLRHGGALPYDRVLSEFRGPAWEFGAVTRFGYDELHIAEYELDIEMEEDPDDPSWCVYELPEHARGNPTFPISNADLARSGSIRKNSRRFRTLRSSNVLWSLVSTKSMSSTRAA